MPHPNGSDTEHRGVLVTALVIGWWSVFGAAGGYLLGEVTLSLGNVLVPGDTRRWLLMAGTSSGSIVGCLGGLVAEWVRRRQR